MRLLKLVSIIGLFVVFFVVVPSANAASLTTARDTITTSRPSPSSPLSAALASTDTQASIFNNGSRYLASDSAKVIKTATSAIVDASTLVSSQSSALTTVFFAEQAGTAAVAAADVLYVPITAMHRLVFTTVTEIPDEGDLEIVFPTLTSGDADNDASPSATTFQFNNLTTASESNPANIEVFDDASNITANVTAAETEPSAGNAGRISIEFDSGPIAAGSVITVYLGCSSAAAASACDTQVPRIINPTKTATAGTADTWKINLTTEDASNNSLDNATVAVATIDSVLVLATVDPTLTFTIAGINNGLAVNTNNTDGCGQTELTNAGINASATVVNLGILANTPSATDTKVSNIAAQLITVSTNSSGGYALTATSSGSLRNPASGYEISDNSTPAVFPDGTQWFGAHACGLDTYNATIGTTFWNTTASNTNCNTYITGSSGNICKYGWPDSSTPINIASDSTGPVGDAVTLGNGLTSVSYAGGMDVTVPAGLYQTYITYVATPTF